MIRKPAALMLTLAMMATTVAITAGPASAAPDGELRRPAPVRAAVDTTAIHLARDKGIDIAEATRRVRAQADQASTATRLVAELGDRSGGGYFNDDGAMVVTVTDAAAASRVQAAGLTPRTVTRSLGALRAIVADLDTTPKVDHSTWAVDVATNQVVVHVPSGAAARRTAAEAGLRAAAERHGAAVRIVETDQTLRLTRDVAGGDPMRPEANLAAYCSAGFNVRYGSGTYVLLAGHCFGPNHQYQHWINWDGYYLGRRHGTPNFPGGDEGLIRITEPVAQIPGVYTYNGMFQWITYAADSYQGQYVCKSGATTGVTCGTIDRKYATVNYAEGAVYNLDGAPICAQGGDSGGSMFAGTAALGMVSGGIGSCNPSFMRTFFKPVLAAMATYQVTLA